MTQSTVNSARPVDLYRVLLGAFATVFLLLCAVFWPFVADDAYIVGRYAQNMAAGDGLVYNIGERVSALTSPLHALLEGALAWAGLHPVESYRVLAPALVLMGWFGALRETGIRGSSFVLFTVLSLLSPFMVLWSVGGLETGLLSFLATLFVARVVTIYRTGAASRYDFLTLGLLAGLMFLTRYDSVLVFGPILLAILLAEFRRPALWLGATFFLCIAGSWLVFAHIYYGDIFPTSYYLKFSLGTRPRIDSISALLNFLLLSGLLFAVSIPKERTSKPSPLLSNAIAVGAAVSLAAYFLYASRSAGEHMMFGYRMFVPYLMGASLVLAMARPTARQSHITVISGFQAAMVCVVALGGMNPAPLTYLPGLKRAYAEYAHVTPADYGRSMAALREDAADIAAHWRQINTDEQPRIYLRTGGTGYWLPGFHVYEALISFRLDCGLNDEAMINASHYVQQLSGSWTWDWVGKIARARYDIMDSDPLLFASSVDWMGEEPTGYLFGPNPKSIKLGNRIQGPCEFSKETALTEAR